MTSTTALRRRTYTDFSKGHSKEWPLKFKASKEALFVENLIESEKKQDVRLAKKRSLILDLRTNSRVGALSMRK